LLPGALIYGPLGICSLVRLKAFYPVTKLNTKTGELEPDHSTRIETLSSRISSLWTHVRASITKFEELPDSGFLGKNVTRFFNRLWNYGFIGTLGTLLILLIQPLLTLLNIIVSGILTITAPVWSPLLALFITLFEILFFDFRKPINSVFYFLFRVFLGLFEILTSALGIIFFPCN